MSESVDKVVLEILKCIKRGDYMEVGVDRNDNGVCYCTYYFPEQRRTHCDCINKGELIKIKSYFGDSEMFTMMEVYKCKKGE